MPYEPTSVIREYAPFVHRVLRHLGVAERQLDDLSQEVLVVVCRQLDKFEGRSSLRTWIYGICRNVAATARRRPAARELLSHELPEQSVGPTQETQLWLKQAYAQLSAVLATLEESQRMVFVLFEIEELEMEEIADVLAAPLTTCYSRLYVAREKVQTLMRKKTRFRRITPVEVVS